MSQKRIAIIGGGPAGLMAADVLTHAGQPVTVYDAMPTVGRKFLLAGKSGLNLTHAEPYADFVTRFGAAGDRLRPALEGFTPDAIRAFADGLGAETFVGSSGRVFPKAMKASPMLRAWLQRLETQGVTILSRHRWLGFADGGIVFETPEGQKTIACDGVLLALGGASWPRLGSDAGWVPWLRDAGIAVDPFRPANCGFDVDWSDTVRQRFAGQPVKSVTATSDAGIINGEFVITGTGIEGSLVYAHAAALRDRLARDGRASLILDLMPGRTAQRLSRDLARQDTKASLSTRLRKGAGLDGVKAALVHEHLSTLDGKTHKPDLATLIKALPVSVTRPRPIAEAISSAGGIRLDALDDTLMLKAMPGVFAAGEMLDWEAPTGGYLLTACLATGRHAAQGMLRWLEMGDFKA